MNKRYNEPKKIGEIMIDIGMGKEDIEYRKPLSVASKEFADDLINNLMAYHEHMEEIEAQHLEIETQHLELVGVIATMEEFYEEQKSILSLYTTLVAKRGVEAKTINTNAHNAQIKLETFCKITMHLCKDLKKIVNQIPLKEDKHIQKKRVDDFLLFFREECRDITDIITKQLNLVQILKNS